MNHIELEEKIKEIMEIENFFDFCMMVHAFESQYKKTEFYKITKMPLMDVIKNARIHYALQLKDLTKKANKFLAELDLEKVQSLIEQFGDKLQTENSEIMEQINALNLGELFNKE